MKNLAITLLMLTAITATSKSNDYDPYLWLEEVEGREALEWVEARNAESLEVLTGTDSYREAFESSLEIMNSDDRVAAPSLRGDYIYNFWQDADTPRGIWRRASKDLYLAGEPDWDVLLDMERYHKLLAGASWIGEYGNPDIPEEWAFIREYSPYHNLREGKDYPTVFFTTSTRDDRVHPGHARKMVAKMMDMGYPVFYWENMEGGHAGASTNEQRAKSFALTYSYLKMMLFD